MRSPSDRTAAFDSPLRAKVRRLVMTSVERAGFRLEPLEDTAEFVDDDSTKTPEMLHRFARIPGMINHRRGMYYYLLAYAQGVRGDIIELGCWQGRSTAFLAQACLDANNGRVHAVDTFRGNPGNEAAYRVGAEDLSDLADQFVKNMIEAGVFDRVTAHVGDSNAMAPTVAAATKDVRMLVVDAEHTYEAVKAELDTYAGLVIPGGLLVFDDYSTRFPGVSQAIREHLAADPDGYARPFQDRNLLVVQKR